MSDFVGDGWKPNFKTASDFTFPTIKSLDEGFGLCVFVDLGVTKPADTWPGSAVFVSLTFDTGFPSLGVSY